MKKPESAGPARFAMQRMAPAADSMPGLGPDIIRVDYVSAHASFSDWALLAPPAKSRTWVVFLHGHGSRGDQIFTKPDLREKWLRPIRGSGLGVAACNLRGNAWMAPEAAEDLHALLRWLRAAHQAGRFLFFSGSMGGTSNLIYATLHPEDCALVAAMGAATDLAAYYHWGRQHKPGIQRQIASAIAQSYGGTPTEKPDVYRKHSPLFSADKLTMPLYLSHGEKDALMPVEQMRALAGRLAKKGNATYVEIKDGNHDSPCFHPPAMEWLLQNAGK